MHEFARGLRDVGRWDEAESLFRESLRLKEEGGDTPTSLAITMRELAMCLRQLGQSAEAKTLERKAKRLEQ